jgi:hypothetical protein
MTREQRQKRAGPDQGDVRGRVGPERGTASNKLAALPVVGAGVATVSGFAAGWTCR